VSAIIAKASATPPTARPSTPARRANDADAPILTTPMNLPELPPPDDDVLWAPSKTKRKHDMQALQDLGVELCALDAKRLASLDLPERLVDAITLAKSITRHEAKRRQMQYIGRLMRDIDAEPLRNALGAWAQGPQREREQFARLERWRDRVMNETDGLQAFIAAYPATDVDALTRLIADTRAERARGAPPRKSRALFRELKRIVDAA
jgi:ribosome-associated protein